VRGLLGRKGRVHRTKVADRVCDRFGFYDARGDKRRSGCLKALRELERQGEYVLPEPRTATKVGSPRRLAGPVAMPEGVPAKAGEVRGLRLVCVDNEQQIRIWNEMMIREHPRGAGPLVGRQLRYLIGSEHGWLGAVGFGAPASGSRPMDRVGRADPPGPS
jgi:hypothetical protein